MLKLELDVIQLQTTSSIALRQTDEGRRNDRLVEQLKAYNKVVDELKSQFDTEKKRSYSTNWDY